jgi:hypothetical protein
MLRALMTEMDELRRLVTRKQVGPIQALAHQYVCVQGILFELREVFGPAVGVDHSGSEPKLERASTVRTVMRSNA